jgi:hypothetical protein
MADAFVPLPVKTATAGDVVVAIDQTTPGTTNLVEVSKIGAGSSTIGAVFIRNPLDSANMGDATNPVRIDPVGVTVQPVSTTGTNVVNVGVLTPLPVSFEQPIAVTTIGTDTVAVTGNVGITGEVPVSFGQPIAVETVGTSVVNIAASAPLDVSFPQPVAVTTLGTDVVNIAAANPIPVSIPQPLAVTTLGTDTVAVSGNVGITGEVPVSFGQPIAVETVGTSVVNIAAANPLPVSFGQPISVETQGTTVLNVQGNVNVNQPVAVTTLGTDVVRTEVTNDVSVVFPQPIAVETVGTSVVKVEADNPLPVNFGQPIAVTTLGTDVVNVTGNLLISPAPPNMKWDHAATANIAAGAETYLDSDFITTGKIGELQHLMVSSSLPIRSELQMLDNGGTNTVSVGFTSAAWPTFPWSLPDNSFNMYSSGTNAWRVRLKNMDNNKAASAYVTWIWEER